MIRAALALATVSLVLAGCAGRARPRGVVESSAPAPTGWRALATPIDQQRIALVPWLWTHALAAVPPRQRARVRAEGALLDPTVALALPAPPPGPYRCRLIRLGGRGGYRTFPPDFCYVDGDSEKLSFTKQTGAALPGGWLHPENDRRLVFLGATPRTGEKAVPLYGTQPAQDVAGVVERVAPFRWRMVLPRAGRGAVLDLYELVPVPPAVPGAAPVRPART